MDYGIRGRVAVVTGGDTGIGLETAKILVGGGARVILTDKDEEDVKNAAEGLAGKVLPMAADLTKPGDIAALHEAAQKLGPVAAVGSTLRVDGGAAGLIRFDRCVGCLGVFGNLS